jgi:hypothetical protein
MREGTQLVKTILGKRNIQFYYNLFSYQFRINMSANQNKIHNIYDSAPTWVVARTAHVAEPEGDHMGGLRAGDGSIQPLFHESTVGKTHISLACVVISPVNMNSPRCHGDTRFTTVTNINLRCY